MKWYQYIQIQYRNEFYSLCLSPVLLAIGACPCICVCRMTIEAFNILRNLWLWNVKWMNVKYIRMRVQFTKYRIVTCLTTECYLLWICIFWNGFVTNSKRCTVRTLKSNTPSLQQLIQLLETSHSLHSTGTNK